MEFGQEMKAILILPSGYLTPYLYREIYKEIQNVYEKQHIIPTRPHMHTQNLLFDIRICYFFTLQSFFVW